MPELFVFKAGKYPQGDWPVERVKKFVDAYDPVNSIEAPAVIGHRSILLRDKDQYSHGWVSRLRMDADGKVYATINDFSSEARQAIREKKLRYVSVELYEFDKCKDTPGAPPYLRAVALLGRDTPAVTGTRIPMFGLFSGGVSGAVDEENHIATFTRKVSAEDIKILSESGQESTNEEEAMDEEVTKRLDALDEKVKALTERVDALEGAAAEGTTAASRKGAEEYYAKLRDEGKLPPAQFAQAVALDMKVGEAERKELRAMFAALDPKMDLSGQHVASKEKAPSPAATESELTAQIRAYQKEHRLSSFSDAATALYAAKPELFKEDGHE